MTRAVMTKCPGVRKKCTVRAPEVLQEGGPLSGPKSGLLSILRNELSEKTPVWKKQETLLGKGCPGAEQERNGTLKEPRKL